MAITISLFLSLFIFIYSSCRKAPTEPLSTKQKGSAKVMIVVNKVGVLSKVTKKADITLKTLFVTLSADEEESINDTIPLPHDGSATVSSIYENLTANKIWTVFARSSDLNDSTIHSGSTKFTILPDQAIPVTLDLTAKFSVLVTRFYPIRDSVNRVQVLLDGYSVADSLFPKQMMVGDTITLKYDYLTTAIPHDITLNVYGDYEGNNMLLYQGIYTLTAMPGENITCTVPLNWVGPIIHPAGDGIITVMLGSIGNATLKGELQGTSPKEPTKVSGSITKNTVWALSNSPYLLTEKITVSTSTTLTIDSGVVINGQGFSIETSGTLLITGSSSSRVTINNTRIVPGRIIGTTKHFLVSIHYAELNSCQFFNSETSYGKGSLILQDSRLSNVPSYILIGAPIADCYIERNIFVNCGYITTELTDSINCYIRNNVFFLQRDNRAVQNALSRGTGKTIVEYNSFLSTDRIAVKIPPKSDSTMLVAENNYWHTLDEDIIADMIFDKNDDSTCAGYIEYKPLLAAPDPGTPRFGD